LIATQAEPAPSSDIRRINCRASVDAEISNIFG